MTKYSTSCEKCNFAKEYGLDDSCFFHIPEAISDIKKVDNKNNYNYIHNYICKYGISKDSAQKIISEYNVDLIEYIKHNISIKYLLFIIVNKNDDITNICNYIKKLNIRPNQISIVFNYEHNPQDAQICEKILAKDYSWKLHYFVVKKEKYEILQNCLSTDTRLEKCQYILILNEQILKFVAEKDSINRINFIVNVQQPNCGMMMYDTSDDFYGMFTLLKNIYGIFQTYPGQDLDKIITENYKQNIIYYD